MIVGHATQRTKPSSDSQNKVMELIKPSRPPSRSLPPSLWQGNYIPTIRRRQFLRIAQSGQCEDQDNSQNNVVSTEDRRTVPGCPIEHGVDRLGIVNLGPCVCACVWVLRWVGCESCRGPARVAREN